jgi:prevent-host-death family protein
MKVTTQATRRKARPASPRSTLGAAEFKAKCLELMDEVERTRIPLTVTKRGKPVVRIVPASSEPLEVFGALKGAVIEMRDIISPIGVAWEAER